MSNYYHTLSGFLASARKHLKAAAKKNGCDATFGLMEFKAWFSDYPGAMKIFKKWEKSKFSLDERPFFLVDDLKKGYTLENIKVLRRKDYLASGARERRQVPSDFGKKVSVAAYDEKNKLIKIFPSLFQAAKFIGNTDLRGNIHRAASGKIKTFKSYRWEFKK